MSRWVVCAHIEGIGPLESAGESGGYMLSTPLPDGFGLTNGGYNWVPWILEDSVSPGESRIEPFSPGWRFAPISFELRGGNPPGYDAEDPGEVLFTKRIRPITRTTAEVLDSDLLIYLESTAGISFGDPLFIGAETVKVTGVFSTYVIVERGHYGSDAARHSAGANVYDGPPFWEGRRVVQYIYDLDTDTLLPRDRGVLEDGFSQDKARIDVGAKQLTAPIRRVRLNRTPHVLSDYRLDVYEDEKKTKSYSGTINGSSLIRKPDSALLSRMWVRVGDSLIGTKDGRTVVHHAMTRNERTRLARPSVPAEFGEDDPVEVFAVHREFDERSLANSGGWYSSTAGLANVPNKLTIAGETIDIEDPAEYPHHPLAIAMALLFSTDSVVSDPGRFDTLRGPDFGPALGFLFTDSAILTAHKLIARTRDYKVDNIVLGWDLDAFEVLEFVERVLMVPFGFRIGRDLEGRLTIFEFRIPDEDDFAEAAATRIRPIGGANATLYFDDGAGSAVDIISATLGELPFRKGREITLKADTGQPDRPTITKGSADLKLNFSSLSVDSVNADGYGLATDIVLSRAMGTHFALKRLRVRALEPYLEGISYGHGSWISIDPLPLRDAWMIGPNGKRVRIDPNAEEWLGQVISVRPDRRRGIVDLELVISGTGIMRKRAPAAVVNFSSGNLLSLLNPSPFGAPDWDGLRFRIGEKVQFWSQYGAIRDTTPSVIADIADPWIMLDYMPAISNGDYMRIAHADTDNSGVGHRTNSSINPLGYLYMADNSDTLGDAQIAAHIFGL